MFQRSRRSFFQISAAAGGAFACLLACGGGGGSESTEGTLVLPIQVQVNGMTYRLNTATFEVVGAETVELTTPNPPSGTVLREALEPGEYSVELVQGWVVERQMGAAFQAISESVITSMNPVSISVVRGQNAPVGFVFDAGGVMVDFGQAAAGGDDDYSD
jgi:hypothetical protein